MNDRSQVAFTTRSVTLCTLLLVIVCGGAQAAALHEKGTAPLSGQPDQATRAKLSDRYGALPLSFIENAGQIDPAARFQVKAAGYTIFFTPDEVVLAVTGGGGEGTDPSSSVVGLRFTGANSSPSAEGIERLPGSANFFRGNDPASIRKISNAKGPDTEGVSDGEELLIDEKNQRIGALEHRDDILDGADRVGRIHLVGQ